MRTIINVFEIAKEINDKGEYFPIWTTCLGFDALAFYFTDFQLKQDYVDSINHSLPIKTNNSFR